MESLVKAASDFLAAILSRLGFIGRPRRRATIRDDLQLLDQVRESPGFGSGSRAHQFLVDHITVDVASYVGIELKRKRKIPWSSVILAFVIGIPLGYWTYRLNEDHFAWISLLPGLVAALMLLAALGMLFGDESDPQQGAQQSEQDGEDTSQRLEPVTAGASRDDLQS